MKTGANVLKSLAKQNCTFDDIVITKGGDWLQNGMVRKPEKILDATDVVFLALHGGYGEDGEVQKLIQRYNIPFTGSRSLPSAVAFNKHLTKETLKAHDIKMPKHRLVTQDDIDSIASIVDEIIGDFGPEYIVKPLASGSSVGINLVRTQNLLQDKLQEALANHEQVLVEEFIRGREATCAALENFRDESVYVFPAIEIIPPVNSDFFTTEAKYSGETREICPGNFSYSEREQLASITAKVHQLLGLSQYSRSDFMIRDGEIYFLEVNTLPGLTEESLFPKAAKAVGLEFDQLVRILVETATT